MRHFIFFLLLLPTCLIGQQLMPRQRTPDASVELLERHGRTLFVGGDFSRVGYYVGGIAAMVPGQSIPDLSFPPAADAFFAFSTGNVQAILPDGQGGWYVGGRFNRYDGQTASNLVHLLPNRQVDLNFSFSTNNLVRSLGWWNDTMLVAGDFTSVNGTPQAYFTAINPQSGTTIPFDLQLNGRVKELIVQGDTLILAGDFTEVLGLKQRGLARILLPDLLPIKTASIANGTINDIDTAGNRLFVGGTFTGEVGTFAGRLGQFLDGSAESEAVFPAANGAVDAVSPDGQGGWYVGGNFTSIGGENKSRLAHILPNNSIDPNFGFTINGRVYAILTFNDTLMIGGTFTQVDGQSRQRLAAFSLSNPALLPWAPAANSTVRALMADEEFIYVGGNFATIDGDNQPKLAAFRRSDGQLVPIPGPPTGEIRTLAQTANGLFAGGTFNDEVGYFTGNLALFSGTNALPALDKFDVNGNVNVVKPDGNGGWYVGGNFFNVDNNNAFRRLIHILPNGLLDSAFTFNFNGEVKDLVRFNDTMLVVGNFTQIDGIARERIAAINVSTFSLLPFALGCNGAIETIYSFNDTILFGGAFTQVQGQTRNRLAAMKISTGTLTPWNPDANSTVRVIRPFQDSILVGGLFFTLGGSPRGRLAMVDKQTGAASPWNPNLNNFSSALWVEGNTLYVGGNFTQAGGTPRSRLASFDLVTQTLNSFDPGADGEVKTMVVWNDTMLIGGAFGTLGGQPRNRLGAIDMNNGSLLAFNPSLNSTVLAIGKQGNQLVLGGQFDLVGATDSRPRLFSLDKATFQPTDWNPQPNNSVWALAAGFNDTVFIGGAFTQLAGQPFSRLAKVSATTGIAQPSWAPQLDGAVKTIGSFNDTVFVGGDFEGLNGQSFPKLTALHATTGLPFAWRPAPGDEVLAVNKQGNQLVIGGEFNTLESEVRNRVFAFDLDQAALAGFYPQLTGGGFFGGGVNAIEARDNEVFLGGKFDAVDGVARQNFAHIDATTGALLPLAPNPDGKVNAMLAWNDTLLWVGDFNQLGGLSRPLAGAVQVTTGAVTDWNPRPNAAPDKLARFNDTVFVMGNFGYLDSRNRQRAYAIDLLQDSITRFNPSIPGNLTDMLAAPDGSKIFVANNGGPQDLTLLAFEPVLGDSVPGFTHSTNDQIRALAYDEARKVLYFGGAFTQVDGQPRSRVAAIDSLGNLLPFSLTMDDLVFDLAFNDTILYMVGRFTTVNGQPRNGTAAVNLDGQLQPWAPRPGNGQARRVTAKRDRVFLAGLFSLMNDSLRRRVAAVDPIRGELYDWDPEVLGAVNTVTPFAEGVMIGGELSQTAGTLSPGMTFVGERSGRQLAKFPLGYSYINEFELVDSVLFVATDTELIDDRIHPYLSQISFTFKPVNSRIESMEPRSGGNAGDLTLRFKGGGFTEGTRVALVSPGLAPIIGIDSATLTYGGTYLETTVSLRNQPPGPRNVVIRIPGDTTFVLENAFTVEGGGEAKPYANTFMPPNVRVGVPFSVYVFYGNTGNVDAHGVPVWLGLSQNMEVIDVGVNELVLIDTTEAWVDSLPAFFAIDTLLRRPFNGKVKSYIFPKIGAGDARMLRLRVMLDSAGTYRAVAWANEGMFGSPLKYVTGECLASIIELAIGLTPAASCVYDLFSTATCPIFETWLNPDYGTKQDAADWAFSAAATVAGCAGDAVTGYMASIMLFILEQAATGKAVYEVAANCFEPEEKDPDEGEGINSFDPNDKVGPQGQGGLRWLRSDRAMPYMIRFENDTSATAPAQVVIIRDTLDLNVYDGSTLKFNSFAIGDKFFAFPLESKRAETVIDLRPAVDALVRVKATFDSLSGEMTWTFVTLDRVSFEPTTDPLAGFLPPNTDGITGTGNVTFLVNTHPTVTTGTLLDNQAAIYFDLNEPIITNKWRNIVDNDPPLSAVLPLPDTVNTTEFEVRWAGTDQGAGIRKYRLYVSEDGGGFQAASHFISDTVITYRGEPGVTYAFYTISLDTALNQEAPPLLPDAVTRVSENATSLDLAVLVDEVKVFPNPNQGRFTVTLQLSRASTFTYRIVDLAGRVVQEARHELSEGLHDLPVAVGAARGLYLLEYQLNGKRGVERIVLR
jgi:hypothetical protein